jgi:ADP-ribose pyrophosphatase YjhB (NUDIX family)
MGIVKEKLSRLAQKASSLGMMRRHGLQQTLANPTLGQPKPKSLDQDWGSTDQPFYRPGANPTVDLAVVRGRDTAKEVLLIQRGPNAAEANKWALPGGFHDTEASKGEPWRPGLETAEEAALRELKEETGLTLDDPDQLHHVGFFAEHGRDARDNDSAWAVSNAFSIEIDKSKGNDIEGLDDAQDARWVKVSELKEIELAFDHRQMLEAAGIL